MSLLANPFGKTFEELLHFISCDIAATYTQENLSDFMYIYVQNCARFEITTIDNIYTFYPLDMIETAPAGAKPSIREIVFQYKLQINGYKSPEDVVVGWRGWKDLENVDYATLGQPKVKIMLSTNDFLKGMEFLVPTKKVVYESMILPHLTMHGIVSKSEVTRQKRPASINRLNAILSRDLGISETEVSENITWRIMSFITSEYYPGVALVDDDISFTKLVIDEKSKVSFVTNIKTNGTNIEYICKAVSHEDMLYLKTVWGLTVNDIIVARNTIGSFASGGGKSNYSFNTPTSGLKISPSIRLTTI